MAITDYQLLIESYKDRSRDELLDIANQLHLPTPYLLEDTPTNELVERIALDQFLHDTPDNIVWPNKLTLS